MKRFFFIIAMMLINLSIWAAKSDVVTSNTAGATVSFSSSGSYEWEWYSTTSKLRSTNYNVDSSTSQTTITIYVSSSCSFSFDYAVSSESSYDKLTITLDGSIIVNGISSTSSSTYSSTLSSGSHFLVLNYSKDGSVNNNEDRAYISGMKFLSSGSSSNPSGNCGINGSNVTWSYNTSTCVLTISGSGQMANYDDNYNYPWSAYRENIKTVNIGNGVTSIGDCAFGFLYAAFTSVSIPSTVTKIGKNSFCGSTKLTSVTVSVCGTC